MSENGERIFLRRISLSKVFYYKVLQHTNKLFFSQSTPESWAQFTHDNITRAEHERMSSIQLRTLIDNILNDTSRDMREQADAVDVAFQRRVDEVQDSKHKMEENLKRVRHFDVNSIL